MEDIKQRRQPPSDCYATDDKRMATQCRVFRRWVNSQLKQVAHGRELTEAVEVFRDAEALLGLVQELANRKAPTSHFQPSDGLSTQENAIALTERLYGHDIAVAVQLACDCFHHTDDAATLPLAQLTLCLDTLWMLAVAAGAGTGPVEEVQTGNTFSGSVDSSTSTLIGQRSKRNSVSSVLPEVEPNYTRTPALDRWLAVQDERLLAWCQDVTSSYEGIHVCNYTTAWRNGLAFLAIVNQQRPDLFNYKARLEKSPLQNLGLAFHLITKEFAVPRLLEAGDVCSLDAIDARSVAIYLTELRSAVEKDRKRRNRPSFEICTTAMENLPQGGPTLEPDPGVTVTVTTTSSRSSSPSASELSFCSEDTSEAENTSQLEDSQLNLADFQQNVERSLAWMLSMEERLGNNFQDLQPFFGDKKGKESIAFEDGIAVQEAADIAALKNSQISDVSSVAEGFVNRLEAARKQFDTHEDLTAHLTKHQATVSRCLRYGHRLVHLVERVQLLATASLSPTSIDEFNSERLPLEHLRSVQAPEVIRMASVLHARWMNLSKATELGNQFLASCLLKRQEALLSAVEIQLEKLEWEKDRQETEQFGCSIQELKSQLNANRRLETYIEANEGLAQRMQDIVILVPSETPNARDAGLEDRIAALATRWSRLVEWVHTHYAQLQNALLHWRHFDEEAEVLADWLGRIEKEVHTTELSKPPETAQKTGKHGALNEKATAEVGTTAQNEVKSAVLDISEAVLACISRYETRWAQLLASLDRRARTVREACGDSIEVQRAVESRVDALVSKWSQLTEPQLDWEEDSNCTAFRTITPSVVMETEHAETSLHQRGSETDEGKQVTEDITSGRPEKRTSLDSGRVALIPTGYRAEFERRAEQLLNWLDSRAEALELVTMKKSDQEVHAEETTSQSNNQAPESINEVLERVGNELVEAKENMAIVYSLGERYRKDLSQAGENVDELDQLFEDINDRWALLDQLFKKATAEANAQAAGLQRITPSETKPNSSSAPPSQDICESAEAFRTWLKNAKDEATCAIKCEDGNQLDDVIANFTRTVQRQPRTSIIEDFLAKLTTADMKELTEKWQELRQLINERITLLHNLCENHDMFINQLERFEKLMTDMFEYLDSVAQANNSQPAAIEAQLQESVEALRDMERMQPTLSNMDNVVDQLAKFFSQSYIESIKGRLTELKKTWNRVKSLTNENISFLRDKLERALAVEEADSLERSPGDQQSISFESCGGPVQEAPITVTGDERLLQQALPRKESNDIEPNTITVKMLDMNELQKWISKAKHRLSKYNSINSAEDLEAFANFLEEFGKELQSKRSMITAIRGGQVTDATGKPVTERTALLFSGHFADLESEYAAGQERLKSATYHLNDFNSLMSYEKHWLNRVETTIGRSKQQVYADVADISEDISAFENLRSEHSEDDFARLQQIVELLSSESTMSQKLSSEFEAYAANVSSALQRLNDRLGELRILIKKTEDTHARLTEYENWLRETEATVQQHLRNGENASSNPDEFAGWCAHINTMDEMVSTIKRTLEKGTGNLPGNAVEPNSLGERAATIQAESANFKRILLQFTYPTDVQDSIACCREAIRENDVSAINLEVVSLASEHISGLVNKSKDLCDRIQDTQELLSCLQSTVSSTQIRPELSACNDDLLMELHDLYNKNAKLYEHVKRFEKSVQMLQPFADQYSLIIDPLEQVMMNVEEVTDYLETADTQKSHIDMLQQIHSELTEVLGQDEDDTVLSAADSSISDVKKPPLQHLEELLTKIESEAIPVDGLSSTIADVRRVINKAFAARTAFRAQIDGMKTATSESSTTQNTEIPLSSKQSADIQGVQVASSEMQEISPQEESNNQLLSTLYTRSNQLIAEMGAFFEDLASFNTYCVKLDQPPKSSTVAAHSEPLQTSITACSKKLEIYQNFYEHYFKQQSQYLESRLNDLVKAANVLPDESRNIVQKVQKLWANSRGHLSWQNEQINQLSKTLKAAEEAFTKYERLPTDKNRQTCLTYITQLEGTYNWSLAQDRARLDREKHGEIARKLTNSLQQTCLLRKLLPFRECLQQFVTQLNEIQDELHSCQSIPTHELSSQIQSLDQYFILAQEAASKATNILNRCKAGHLPVALTDDSNESGQGGNELGNLLWLEAVLETQKGRLNSYCNEFHVCRPYWQEYTHLWQSFMNEAIRQKHQIAMLQLDRRPSEDQTNRETSEGSARDYAVNLCSSVLTLQRLGSKLVWKAQRGEVGQGLDSDLYLQPVFDKRCSHRPLRNEANLRNDIAFVNETFDALVGDLKTLARKYAIDGFLPPNLRIDAASLESQTSGKADSSGDTDGVLETTFPQNLTLERSEDLGVTNVEACLNRLKEELIWLEENQLYVPVVEIPTNYISKLDAEFWLPPGAAGPLRLSSNWAKRKAQDLSKLDSALKTHERRSGQLCTISEKLSADLEDSETRRRLHEAADELHACMESARGIINRRRTRLVSWLTTCLTFEAAMLMDSDGEEVDKGGEQTLPVWISTIRKRLEMSSPNLDSPMFQRELEQLRREFDPAGSGTGQTLRAVELAFETQPSDSQLPLQNHQCGVFPQLDPGVVDSIQICLNEWKNVCRLLRISESEVVLSQDSDQRHQQTSPMTQESGLDASVKKLASWLDTVTAYLSSNVACLGGNFNQEAVIAHIKNRPGDQKSYTVRSIYPEVIQIQLQQYAIELDARKPQLEKLQIEAGRLTEGSGSKDASPNQLVSMVEEVRQSWNSTSAQVKARLDELEKMLMATDELKTAERELDRWLSRAEADLANALSNTQEATERKRQIQEIIDRLPAGETKFTAHQNKCEAILSKYSKEDTQKFRSDQEAIRSRWSHLVSRLRESLESTSQTDSDFIEIPISTHARSPETDLQKIARLRSVSTQQAGSYRSTEHFLPPEPRSMETSMIETSYNLGSPVRGYSSSTLGRHGFDQKPPFLGEAYRGNQLSRSVDIRIRPCDSRPVMRMPLENWPLFLAQLRQMNDWLAHQDAAFHQLRGTVGGDSESVSQLINSFSVLEEELQQQRFQVEELLDRGHVFLKDQFGDTRLGSLVESEGDSDGSEIDLANVDFDESSMSTKRIIRRIKRHLKYLDKHWAELNGSMLTYRQQLDRAFQKLTVFERVLDDAERELASTQKLLMSRDPSSPTDDQVLQVIWDTCASVTHVIAGLDGQALRLSDDGTIISHVLISRLDGLKIGLERLRSETNDEMNRPPTRNDEAGVLPVSQRPLRSPPQHLLEGDRPASVASTAGARAPIPRPKSPSECWLQAFKTIPYPWERCLLPSGNQVPYYKNHATHETQWDHPIMVDLLQRLDESNAIRFPAYRTAIKIRQIQHTLFFDQIPLNVATETFARHGLSSPLCSEGCDGRVMDVPQIVNCLTTLYCRVWDTLVSQPDVVRVTDPGVSGTKAGALPQNASESTLSGAGRLASANESYSASENRPKPRRTPTHRSAIKCMTSVLCVSGSKNSRERDDEEDNLDAEDGGPRQPASRSDPQHGEGASPERLIPAESHVPTSFSRVDKLQTILKLPDGREFSLPTCVDLALNLLLNSFDSSRNGSIRVLSFKVTIFLLINASLEEKYQYLFSLVADRDNKINDSRLWLLIYETMQLPRQLGEVQATNNNLDPNILMCFARNLKVGVHENRPNGATRTPTMESQRSVTWPSNESDSLPSVGLDRFYEWLKLEPPMIAWVPALHRLVAGEKLIHQVRCAVCQTYPMRGLRYRCLRCLNFDLCQNCFLVGRVEKSHKVTHPTQEYTTTLQRSDSLRDFTRVVRNRFRSKDKFRQSSFDTEDASKPTTASRPTGRTTPTLHDRPPRSMAFRQNSTGVQHPSRTSATWQANRPASLGDTRKRVLPTGSTGGGVNSLPRLAGKPPRGAYVDQEHELIAQYSQSLRRQNSFASSGMPMPGCQQSSYFGPREPHYPMAGPWQYCGEVYDRSRAPEPRFFTMRPNQHRGGGGFRASSQPPPPHGGSSVFVPGPQINSHVNWYRNQSGWSGPVVAGSAGSLDKVLMNLEEENRFLRAEYDWLRLHSSGQNLRPMRSPSLQYPLSQHGAYQEADRYHSPAYYGNPYYPGYSPTHPPHGSQTERIYPSSNGILYGGSLGRASGPAAHTAFLRSSGGGGGPCRPGFEQSNQRYQSSTAKPTPVPTPQQPAYPPMQEGELAQEARLLRQHKTRLESRMQLLEDHNKALEDQLNRLRRYLNIPASASANPISVTASPNAPSQSFDQTCTQSFTRTNGTADQQSGNGYLGAQYNPISDELPPTPSYTTPVDPPVLNQGQGRSGTLTGVSP